MMKSLKIGIKENHRILYKDNLMQWFKCFNCMAIKSLQGYNY